MDYNYSAYRRGNRGSPQQPHRWSKWLPWVYTGIQAALMTAFVVEIIALPQHVLQKWFAGYLDVITLGLVPGAVAVLMNRYPLGQLCAGIGTTAGAALLLMRTPFADPAFPAEAETAMLLAILLCPVIMIGAVLHERLLLKWD